MVRDASPGLLSYSLRQRRAGLEEGHYPGAEADNHEPGQEPTTFPCWLANPGEQEGKCSPLMHIWTDDHHEPLQTPFLHPHLTD